MKYLAFIPSASLILPIVQPFLVELRKTKNSPNYFAKQFNASFLVTMLIATPITSVLFVHHQTVTAVLLGANWIQYSEMLGAFALLIPAFVMLNQSKRVLILYGKTKHIFIYECIAFGVLYSSLFAVGFSDIKFFTYVRVGIENLICAFLLLYIVLRYTSVKNTLSLFMSFIPLTIAAYLCIFVSEITAQWSDQVFIKLVVVTSSSFFTFYATVFLFHILWLKKVPEWQYLETLLQRVFNPFLKRLPFHRGA
jgi:O-antigen/teichoic acid export membrane protein